ncbi:MAG: hypothetical protein OXC30_00125 [Alphaproteobacteria bacterium]|nr:hypothetical protein [Alphaproteobacteria bacterium]
MKFILLFLLCFYANGATVMPTDCDPEKTEFIRQQLHAKKYHEYTNDEASSIASHICALLRLADKSVEPFSFGLNARTVDSQNGSPLDLHVLRTAFSSITQSVTADENITLDPCAPKEQLILSCQHLFHPHLSARILADAESSYKLWHSAEQEYSLP